MKRHVIGTGPLSATILDQGSVLQDVRLEGVDHSLTLGSPDLGLYETKMASFGGLIGPVVNRISKAQATLDGVALTFEENKPGYTLHSGSAGTHRKRWEVEEAGQDALALTLHLPDGEGGFPGERDLRAEWRVDGAELTLVVEATTDRPTYMNVANHSYWNLDGSESVDGHTLHMAAERYMIHDAKGLPTGNIRPVDGSIFDFREPRAIQTGAAPHYDNNIVLADGRRELTVVAVLTGVTGTKMTMATTEPGLQIYDASKMEDLGVPDHQGRPFGAFRGLALEAQGWPDAMNHEGWPSVRLDPGRLYRQVTRWSFEAPT